MDGYKAILASKTIWGSMMTLAGSALAFGHYTLTPADAASAVDIIVGMITGASGLVTIWGRVVASKRLGAPPLQGAAMVLVAIGLAVAAAIGEVRAQDTPAPPPPAARPADVQHAARPARPRVAATTPARAAAPAAASAAGGGKLTATAAQKNPVAVLQAFSLTDLQAALADAQGQTPPDAIAASCYQALITVIGNPIANPLPSGPGLFQLLQKGRDLKTAIANLQTSNGPLAPLQIGCAPLILDAQNTLIQLGILSGAVVGGGMLGIPPILPLGRNDEAPNFLAYQQARDRWLISSRE
jgi:hypothetical protein